MITLSISADLLRAYTSLVLPKGLKQHSSSSAVHLAADGNALRVAVQVPGMTCIQRIEAGTSLLKELYWPDTNDFPPVISLGTVAIKGMLDKLSRMILLSVEAGQVRVRPVDGDYNSPEVVFPYWRPTEQLTLFADLDGVPKPDVGDFDSTPFLGLDIARLAMLQRAVRLLGAQSTQPVLTNYRGRQVVRWPDLGAFVAILDALPANREYCRMPEWMEGADPSSYRTLSDALCIQAPEEHEEEEQQLSFPENDPEDIAAAEAERALREAAGAADAEEIPADNALDILPVFSENEGEE